MTPQEKIEAIRKAYEEALNIWQFDEYNAKITRVVFYLRALKIRQNQPFSSIYVQTKIIQFLEEELDKAFNALPQNAVEDLFQLLEVVP